MTRSKLAAAMVAGFLMGQAFGPCDRVALPVPCGCEDAAAVSKSTPARAPDGLITPSRGRQLARRRGAAHHFFQCDAASADAAVR